MFTWVKFILTCIDFVPMILFSLVLFRQRLKPHWRQITLAALAGAMVAYFDNWPLLYVSIICVLLMFTWKFSLVPSLIIALSGYITSVIVSTIVLFSCDLTQVAAYSDIKANPLMTVMILFLTILAKCSIIVIIHKLRFGFTFLTNYTRIPLNQENAGFYLFIIVVILGIAYRHTYPDSVLNALMPIQMLSMATILFLYVMLGKELDFGR